MAEDKDRKMPADSEPDEEGMSEAEVDRNLMGSFPASDPPSWTVGTDHREESSESAADPLDGQKGRD